jgi:tetrahydromethanopterin S-methyltransferase subunit F
MLAAMLRQSRSGRVWTLPLLAIALLLRPSSASAGFFSCTKNAPGISALGWCDTRGNFAGFIHLGTVLWAFTDGDVKALVQLALVTEAGGSVRAGQAGLLNMTRSNLTGVQVGLANTVGHKASGLQLGLLGSTALQLAGAQLSLFRNETDSGSGLQLGSVHNRANMFTGMQAHLGALYAWPVLPYRLARHGDLRARREIFAWVGLIASGLNSTRTLDGIQIGGWMNDATERLRGLQLGALNRAGELKGLQVGIVNWVTPGDADGTGEGVGVQLGLVNRSRTWTGLQVGLVNSATRLRGLQLGLMNHAVNSRLPVTPFFNLAW